MLFRQRIVPLLVACALGAPGLASAQTRGATRSRYTPPAYPEEAGKKDQQGNVLLIGRIKADGAVADLRLLSATQKDFVAPALESVRLWHFDPALSGGKPIEIALNAGVRFRITGDARGRIPLPMLGDLAVFPADAAGTKTAPDGFPVRKGKDAAIRAEAALDVPPSEQPRTMTVKVEAISPHKRSVAAFTPPLAVPALASEVKVPTVIPVGADWEEGVWILRYTIDGKNAGGGQFWFAEHPETFRFVIPNP